MTRKSESIYRQNRRLSADVVKLKSWDKKALSRRAGVGELFVGEQDQEGFFMDKLEQETFYR